MDSWLDGQKHEMTGVWIDGWIDKCTDKWMNTKGWMNVSVDKCIDGSVGDWMEEWMEW